MKNNQNTVHYKKIFSLFTALIITLVLYSCNQEVSVTPPDKLPPDGYILLESNPNGAHIYLNGRDTRRITPDSLTYLNSGTYNFTLKKTLFRDTSFTSEIVEGVKKTRKIDYTKNPLMLGNINCDSSPKGASIFINDSATGQVTPSVIKGLVPGYYNVKYRLSNHEDKQISVVVQSSQSTDLSSTLVDTSMWQVFTTSNSPLRSNELTCVASDKNNNIWVGTEDQGLMRYDGTTWKNWFANIDNLPDNKVRVIAVEDNGDVWAGTKFGVLVITSAGTEQYNSFFNGSPFIDPFINDLKPKPNGYMFIVTDSTFMIENKTSYRTWSLVNSDYYAAYGHFSAVEVDNYNGYWLGTVSKGIFMYNKNIPGKNFFNTGTTREIGDSVTAIRVSKATGKVWIGYKWSVVAGSGLSYYDNGNLKAPGVIPFKQNTNSIYIDDTNRKYIGTTGGLVVFDDVSNTTVYDSQTTGLDMDDVRGVTKDQQGRIWIATHGGGLILKKK